MVPAWRLDEKRAERFGADEGRVRQRLLESIKGLDEVDARRAFMDAKWEPGAQAFVGKGGYTILWRKRLKPEEPAGEGNEQFPEGTVVLVRMPVAGGR